MYVYKRPIKFGRFLLQIDGIGSGDFQFGGITITQ